MKTHVLTVITFVILGVGQLYGQTTIWAENFESGGSSWSLDPDPGSILGTDNIWIVNNVYAGGTYMAMGMLPVSVPNVANQPAGINGSPNSHYLHIVNTGALGGGVANANFLGGMGGDNTNAISPAFPTTGYTGVKLSYWWLNNGVQGDVYYSTDNGTTWTLITTHTGSSVWQQVTHTIPNLDNKPQVKLKFNWNGGTGGDDPAFSVDDIRVYTEGGTPPPPPANTLTNLVPSPADLCEGYGTNNAASINFTASGTFNADNQYIAELSNASGSFASPIQIGIIGSTLTNQVVTLSPMTIPNSLIPSANYKIRIRSTDPAVISDSVLFVVHPYPKFNSAQTVTKLPDCGISNGSIKVTATGGTNNKVFTIAPLIENAPQTNMGSTHFFDSLPSNVYKVYVRDGTDSTCMDSIEVSIVIPGTPTVTSSSVNVSCFGANDGEIQVIATNGNGAFHHILKDENGVELHNFVDPSVHSTAIYDELPPGKYTVSIEDDNNCPYIHTFTITEPDSIIFNVKAHDANCGANTGMIEWTISGGTGQLIVSIDGVAQSIDSTKAWFILPGTYLVEVADVNGCKKDTTVSIDAGNGGTIDEATLMIIHSGCAGLCSGSLVAHSPTAATYTLDNITNTTGVFANLCHGDYKLLVSNGTGCEVEQTVVVMSVDPPKADFGYSPANPTTFNANVTFHNYSTNATKHVWSISDVRTGYQFSTDKASFSHEFQSPDSNMYHVCLTASNDFGCSDIVCKDIAIQDEIMLFIPNTFTPDNNEYNQTWKIIAIGIDVQHFTCYVYNRWGELVYESHDPSVGWDATYDGTPIPEGMYSWKIIVKDPINDYKKEYTGVLNVIR